MVEDRLEAPALIVVLLVVIAALEWWRSLSELPYAPKLYTGMAFVALSFAAWRFFRLRPQLKDLRQAAEGEKAVGQFLEELRLHGYKVFHDVVGDGFNLDHVVIGRAGVFAVETKTWSKPRRGEAGIAFDGTRLKVGDRKPDERVVIQARAQAAWLRELLNASTGRPFLVRSVVLFPGWFIEQSSGSMKEIELPVEAHPRSDPLFARRRWRVIQTFLKHHNAHC